MDPNRLPDLYGSQQLAEISEYTNLLSPPLSAAEVEKDLSILKDVEIIFGGWGMLLLDAEVLRWAPRLAAVFYGAGTVKSFVTDELWARGIIVTNAQRANAIPVAEYCVASILFSLKQGFRHMRRSAQLRTWRRDSNLPGAYESTVGLVSLGVIGRLTLARLQQHDLKVLVCTVGMSPEEALALGVELVTLEELFRRSDVVSLHTPELPETRGMIRGEHFRSMPRNATLINTARGAVVNQPEMVEALRERPDLSAVLDVLDPEPPSDDAEIFGLPNVYITPHIAGSLGRECRRLGQAAIDECKRYLEGLPLKHKVVAADLPNMA